MPIPRNNGCGLPAKSVGLRGVGGAELESLLKKRGAEDTSAGFIRRSRGSSGKVTQINRMAPGTPREKAKEVFLSPKKKGGGTNEGNPFGAGKDSISQVRTTSGDALKKESNETGYPQRGEGAEESPGNSQRMRYFYYRENQKGTTWEEKKKNHETHKIVPFTFTEKDS